MKDLINNRYRIIKTIGQGGMGLIYLVEDSLKDNMPFALKTIRQELIVRSRSERIESFKNEYEIMTRLKHPSLTRVYEFGEDEDNYFILMEYLPGILLSEKKCDSSSAIDIVVQILRALEYIHSRNIIYRDMKPRNIVLIGDRVKLLDFGLSGFKREKEDSIKGTLLYMPPETMYGTISFSADIFSLGIVFYELITASCYFPRDKSASKMILAILNDYEKFMSYQKIMLSKVKDNSIAKIIEKMTCYNALDRYSKCSDIISDINTGLGLSYEYETDETKASYVLGNAFADRTSELANLISYVSGKKKYHSIICSGRTGVGKTRLFLEFRKFCRLNNITFYETSCMPGDTKKYSSISEILSQIIIRASDELLERFGKYIRLILSNDRIDRYKAIEIIEDPKTMQNIIVQNISDFITESSKEHDGPAIIYINDLQWIDDGSMFVITNLLNRMNIRDLGLRLFANINHDMLDKNERIKDIFEVKGLKKFDLHPLDRDGVNEYIENVFGKRFLGESIRDAINSIRERVGGNPLFLEELIKSLIDRGIIVKEKRYWQLSGDIDGVDIPSSLVDIIKERVSRLFLDDGKKKVLKLLSLLRIDLNLDIINRIFEKVSVKNTAKILLELENLEIIRSVGQQRGITYSYTSSLIKDVIKDSIVNKAGLSIMLAETLESMPGNDYAQEIAYQYLQGGSLKKAVSYYIICGNNAKAGYFNEMALKYYNTALSLIEDDDKRSAVEINLKKASVLELTGRWEEAEEINRHSLDIVKQIKDKGMLADCLICYGNIKRIRSSYAHALKYYEEALSIYEEMGRLKGISSALRDIGMVYFTLGQYDKASAYYDRNINIAVESNNKREIAIAKIDKALIYYVTGQYHKALDSYRTIRTFFEETRDKREIARINGNMGLVYYDLYQFDKALECYEKNREICEDIGDKQGVGMADSNIGLVYYNMGEYEKAIKHHSRFREISEELGDIRGIAISTGNIGIVYYDLQQYSEALESFKIYRKISQDIGDLRGVGIATSNIGLVYYDLGKYQKALNYFLKYKEICNKTVNKPGLAIVHGNIGRVYYNLGNYSEAVKYFNRSESISKIIGDRYGIADALSNLGDICYYREEYKEASGYYERATQIFRELNVKEPSMINCLIKQSRILLLRGDMTGALEKDKEAGSIAEETGLKKYIRYVLINKLVIEYASGKHNAVSTLETLLPEIDDEEQRGFLCYELYMLEKNAKYRESAINIYQSLYERIPKHEYIYRIKRLTGKTE